MSDEKSSGIIKFVTNEWWLFSYRSITGVCALIITAYVVGTHDDLKTLTADLAAFKINYEARVSRIEGSYGELRSIVDAHRTRIAGNDTDIRSLWNRVYEIATRLGNTQAK